MARGRWGGKEGARAGLEGGPGLQHECKGGSVEEGGGRGLTSASHTFQPPQEGCPGGRNKRKEADVEARPRPEGTALRAGACMLET